ncbi:MAG: hypothetical protein IJZ35_09875 [Clostridia bacterium]|nr:hypothetical protein [Clostridia bacterium]
MRNINNEKRIISEESNGVTRIYPDDDKEKVVRKKKKKSKNKNKNTAPFSSKILILAVAAILLLVFLLANGASGGFVSTVNGKMVAALTKNSVDEFDYSVDAENIYAFSSNKDGFVLLADAEIAFTDASGEIFARQQHSYSNPVLVQRDNRCMIFDKGESTYSLMKNMSLVSQQSVNEDIINAAISSKSNYAIAVREKDSAKCILYGFNGNGKLIYQWNCTNGYIADVAMNDSGSKVAVTVINAENAVLCSSVYVLDFEYDTAYAQFDYADETVIGTKFLSDKKIQVVTDKRLYLISAKEQEVVYEYDSADIAYANVTEDAYTAVVTKSYVHDDSYTLSVFTSSGKLKYSVELTGEVCGLDSSNKSIAVLFNDKTETYSSSGKLVGTTTGLHYYKDIVINGNYLFVLSSDSVKKCTAYGNYEAVYNYGYDDTADDAVVDYFEDETV